MNIDDIDPDELTKAIDNAPVHKFAFMFSELAAAESEQVFVTFCRLDDHNWVSAVCFPSQGEPIMLPLVKGDRCQSMKGKRYELEAFTQEIHKLTTIDEQRQPRMVILPISTNLKQTKGGQGQSQLSLKTAIGQVLAEEINNRDENNQLMPLLQAKLPIIVNPFDPFEL